MLYFSHGAKAKETLEEIYEGYRQEARLKGMGYRFLWIYMKDVPDQGKLYHLHYGKNKWGVNIKGLSGEFAVMSICRDNETVSSKLIMGASPDICFLAQMAQNRIISVRSFDKDESRNEIISADIYFGKEIHPLGIIPGTWYSSQLGLHIFDNHNNKVRFFDKKRLQYSYCRSFDESRGIGSKDGLITDFQKDVIHLISWRPHELEELKLTTGAFHARIPLLFNCANILVILPACLIFLSNEGSIKEMTWDNKTRKYLGPHGISSVPIVGDRHQRIVHNKGSRKIIYLHTLSAPICVVKIEFTRMSLGSWRYMTSSERHRLETIVLTCRRYAPKLPKPIIDEILSHL